MNKERLSEITREVLSKWPLYQDEGFLQVTPVGHGWSIMYCGKFDGRPFTWEMHRAEPPPNLVTMNISADGSVLYLLFIQVLPEERGKGYGDQLYKLVIELAERLGCTEVRQTPSGGPEGETRESYLLRRGWQADDPEVFWPIKAAQRS